MRRLSGQFGSRSRFLHHLPILLPHPRPKLITPLPHKRIRDLLRRIHPPKLHHLRPAPVLPDGLSGNQVVRIPAQHEPHYVLLPLRRDGDVDGGVGRVEEGVGDVATVGDGDVELVVLSVVEEEVVGVAVGSDGEDADGALDEGLAGDIGKALGLRGDADHVVVMGVPVRVFLEDGLDGVRGEEREGVGDVVAEVFLGPVFPVGEGLDGDEGEAFGSDGTDKEGDGSVLLASAENGQGVGFDCGVVDDRASGKCAWGIGANGILSTSTLVFVIYHMETGKQDLDLRTLSWPVPRFLPQQDLERPEYLGIYHMLDPVPQAHLESRQQGPRQDFARLPV